MKPNIVCTGSLLAGASALFLLAGCATERPTEQALVCPQCKEVTIEHFPKAISPDEEISYPHANEYWTQIEHVCPGCQGALTTLFKEGKWQHKCSICEQSPFSCPVSHR